MRARSFFISYYAIVVLVSFLSILLSIGMFSEALQTVLYISVLGIITVILTFLRIGIIRYGNAVVRAPSAELHREDDVLLQAIAMSQSLLLFFVNVTLESIIAKLFLSTVIAVFFVSFYLVRAYAKIKGSPKCRYYSAYLLGIILTYTIAISVFVSSNQPLSSFLSRPLIPDLLLSVFVPFYAWDIYYDFTKKILKKRYGYS